MGTLRSETARRNKPQGTRGTNRRGLRRVQLWIPNTDSPAFRAEAHRQSLAVAANEREKDDQAFVDSISDGLGMQRSEIWTVAGGPDYAGKPRPAVIIQSDLFNATNSVTICPITSNTVDASLFRLPVQPSSLNGLHPRSHLMTDKITTIRRDKLGVRVGRLALADLARLNRALILFLNLVEK